MMPLRFSFWLCVGLVLCPTLSSAAPTLIQHVSTSSNYDPSEVGNNFKIHLADPALANNCVIVGISYPNATGRTVAISDNKGNTWTAGPTATNGSTTTRLYYVTGVIAGTRDVVVTFNAALAGFQAVLSEFYGVAVTSAADGSSGNGASNVPTVTAGSLTTSTAGDLVYTYGFTNNYSAPFSGMAAAGGATILSADRLRGSAAQYQIQASAGTITPTLTISASSGGFNAVALALKAASAGTAPGPGIHIVHVYHGFWLGSPATLQFPATGNLIVWVTSFGTGNTNVSQIATSPSNTWTKVVTADTTSDVPQMFYAANANTSPSMTFTMTISQPAVQFVIYDIAGAQASPFDRAATARGADSNNADVLNAPVLTTTSGPGLAIATLPMGHGPPTGNVGAGYYFDGVTYPGEADGSTFESSDGYAHTNYASPGTLSFGWTVAAQVLPSGWQALAVAFKGVAETGGQLVPPTNLRTIP